MSELLIPDPVVQMNLAAHGDAGQKWLAALPALVAELEERWHLAAVGPAFEGGVVGFVAPAVRGDGKPVVIKVSYVEDETRNEADALAFWDGDGAVRLLEADRNRGALLLERLDPGTSLAAHPDREEAISVACALLRRLWRPVPNPHPFGSVPALAARWAHEIGERFRRAGGPFERHLVDQATRLCVELARSSEEPVLANSDYHLGNVLAARREPWVLIDPKPLVGERAFDTGHFLRSLLPVDLDRSSVGRLVSRVAGELDLDAEHVRSWAFVRSVEDALWGLNVGRTDVGWDLDRARALA